METSGKLADGPLPTILHSLFAAKATGVVRLETRMGQHALFLRDGYPVSVTLPGSVEMIGKVLLEMGFLDENNYRQSMAQPPPKGKRFGDFLIERGLVTAEQVRLGLKAQVRRKLHRLFFLNDGSWVFQAGEHNQGIQGTESLRVHPYRAIYHGVRSSWPADQLQGALFLLEGKAIKAKISAEESARYGLGPDDGRAAELLRKGYWTVVDLAEGAGLPTQPIHALVYSFYITDSLDIQLADAVPRLKRKADSATPPPSEPLSESSGAWKMPSGSFKLPQPSTGSFKAPQPVTGSGAFSVPQPTTPKNIMRPGGPPVVVTTPAQGSAPLTVGKLSAGRKSLALGDVLSAAPHRRHRRRGRAPPDRAQGQGGRGGDAVRGVGPRSHLWPRGGQDGLLRSRPPLPSGSSRLAGAGGAAAGRREDFPPRERGPLHPVRRQPAREIPPGAGQAALRRGRRRARQGDEDAGGGDGLPARRDPGAQERLRRRAPELEAAVHANPTEGEHLAYLIWARLCLGQISHSDARPRFQEAVKLTPKCARGFYFLGLCYKHDNDMDKAYNAFRKASELDPRLLDAEREMRLINMRKEKGSKSGLFSKLLNKK